MSSSSDMSSSLRGGLAVHSSTVQPSLTVDARLRYLLHVRNSLIAVSVILVLGCAADPTAEPEDAAPSVDGGREVDGAGAVDASSPPTTDGGPALLDAAPPAVVARLNEVDCREPAWAEVVGEAPDTVLDRLTVNGVPVPSGSPGRAVVALPALVCGRDVVTLLGSEGALDTHTPPLGVAAVTSGRLPDGVGEWGPTRPTRGAPNAPLDAPDVFGEAITPVSLILQPRHLDWLGGAADAAAPVEVRVGPTAISAATSATVRLVGRDGRRRPLSARPSLQLTFDPPWQGLTGLELDGAPLDPAVLRRWLVAEMGRALGLPAPRVGFVTLELQGVERGLYLAVEPYDPGFGALRFASTGHVYRARRGVLSEPGRFDVVAGPAHDRLDVEWLARAATGPALEEVLDVPRALRQWTLEVWIGAVDAYGSTGGVLWLHADEVPRFTTLPVRGDQAFRVAPPLRTAGGGFLRDCRADPICAPRLEVALDAVAAALTPERWLPQLEARAARLRPAVAADPRTNFSVAMFDAEVAGIADFVRARAAQAAELGRCLAQADDTDGDGRVCDGDCDPAEAAIWLGAPEICGDGVDQSCSGVADDAPACGADCALATRGSKRYRVCTRSRSYPAAREACAVHGMALARADDAEENAWLHGQLQARGHNQGWIGLDDTFEEGVFRWSDGAWADEGYQNWGGGEPNDYGTGEDCAHLRGDGRWNDLPCDRGLPSVCEAECEGGVDADGDGVDRCADCDDGDPDVAPGAVDRCGDDVDQDCDGLVDNGPECGCARRERDGQTWLLCSDALAYDAAQAACEAEGTTLAMPDDPALAEWLWQQAVAYRPASWWIGLDDRIDEGVFVWLDGARPRWTRWDRSEPNDGGGREDCAHFWANRPTWNDASCETALGYLCGPL
jgi:hypothetical protein